jgi:hypothetical protein
MSKPDKRTITLIGIEFEVVEQTQSLTTIRGEVTPNDSEGVIEDLEELEFINVEVKHQNGKVIITAQMKRN